MLVRSKWCLKSAQVLLGILNFAAFVVPLGRLHMRPIQLASRPLYRLLPHCQTSVPQEIEDLMLEIWLIRGGQPKSPSGPPGRKNFSLPHGGLQQYPPIVNLGHVG
ncbi:hypothetical protein M8J75_016568 [Diaphorina citri]|nr:hypothetical protein M8J75_016568 [Diaphorina citri]